MLFNLLLESIIFFPEDFEFLLLLFDLPDVFLLFILPVILNLSQLLNFKVLDPDLVLQSLHLSFQLINSPILIK